MRDGSKPPPSGPGQVQMPGGDASPKALPPTQSNGFAERHSKPSAQAQPKGILPRRPDSGDITGLHKRSDLVRPELSTTPPKELLPAKFEGKMPPFNGEAPLAEPPAGKAQLPAASPGAAPEIPKDSIIPVDIDLSFEEDSQPALAALATPYFGAIDANARIALETMFSILVENRGKPVELKQGKVFIGGKECGDIYSTKASGENLRLSFRRLGFTNSEISQNSALLSKLGSFFNTINDAFLVRACESNEYAAIAASASGVRLSFYKAGSDAPSNSFPLRQKKEEEN